MKAFNEIFTAAEKMAMEDNATHLYPVYFYDAMLNEVVHPLTSEEDSLANEYFASRIDDVQIALAFEKTKIEVNKNIINGAYTGKILPHPKMMQTLGLARYIAYTFKNNTMKNVFMVVAGILTNASPAFNSLFFDSPIRTDRDGLMDKNALALIGNCGEEWERICALLSVMDDIENGKMTRANNVIDFRQIVSEIAIASAASSAHDNDFFNDLFTERIRKNKDKTVDVKKISIPNCENLLSKYEKSKPFIGREKEIEQMMECLERMEKPNVVLVGQPGVGKTDIVRGFAKKLADGDVPDVLKGSVLLSIQISDMVAGSELRGSFEKKLKETFERISKLDRPIVFIDELHTIIGAGKTMDSNMDAANILKPMLSDGKIRIIGATTDDEYRKYIESDKAFMRRFQEVKVNEPSPENAIKILNGAKKAYEKFHSVKIAKTAIDEAVNLSVRYMHDRFLPDKAIDIVDQTCARVKLHNRNTVNESDIQKTVSDMCKIPVVAEKDEIEVVKHLDDTLKLSVFGQDTAIEQLTYAIQLAKVGLKNPEKPIGSFLFVGPSGVGKTEVAKQLAKAMNIDFIRFDMSEYSQSHSIAKFIGSPAGYVGYDDGGILVESVRKHPNSVLLFDEIEKAHPEIYKIFLQMLDYGVVSDNKGRQADFRNTVIIMTSNAGTRDAAKASIGFNGSYQQTKMEKVMTAVEELMPPELRGRITNTIVFSPINDAMAEKIIEKELCTLKNRLKEKKVNAAFSKSAMERIAEIGISDEYGAREIQKAIDRNITTLFVKYLLEKDSANTKMQKVIVDYIDNNFVITNVNKEKVEESVTVSAC